MWPGHYETCAFSMASPGMMCCIGVAGHFMKRLDDGFVWDGLDRADPASSRGWTTRDLCKSLPDPLLSDSMTNFLEVSQLKWAGRRRTWQLGFLSTNGSGASPILLCSGEMLIIQCMCVIE